MVEYCCQGKSSQTKRTEFKHAPCRDLAPRLIEIRRAFNIIISINRSVKPQLLRYD